MQPDRKLCPDIKHPQHALLWMLQGLCLFCLSLPDLFDKETFLTVQALHFPFVLDHQHTFAIRTWLRNRHLPRCKITFRVIGASIEDPPLARSAFHNFAIAALRTMHVNLFQPRLCVTALREIAATDEFTKTSPTDYQIMPALWAIPSNLLQFGFGFGHFLAGVFQFR